MFEIYNQNLLNIREKQAINNHFWSLPSIIIDLFGLILTYTISYIFNINSI